MAETSKQKIGTIYKIAAFLAFLMMGYLGIRSYKNSVEKLKTNGCIEEIAELVKNIQFAYRNQISYAELEYNTAVSLKLIPTKMFKPNYRDAINSFIGGVDMFYSSLNEEDDKKAFEVSFQGLSSYGCKSLLKMPWDSGDSANLIAVGGYSSPMPSGVLDTVLINMPQDEIKDPHIFTTEYLRFAPDSRISNACNCKGNNCSVVWKFR